jgi:hypothetical protein
VNPEGTFATSYSRRNRCGNGEHGLLLKSGRNGSFSRNGSQIIFLYRRVELRGWLSIFEPRTDSPWTRTHSGLWNLIRKGFRQKSIYWRRSNSNLWGGRQYRCHFSRWRSALLNRDGIGGRY